MYKLHLILKYLRKRRIAWVSLIAVMLCTTMVLVVISIMGGWLRMFRESFHGLNGDIVVSADSLVGFPHYREMIRRIEQLPEVKAAVPVIRTFALINILNQARKGVEVVGYPPDIARVNEFPESLHRLKGADRIGFELHPDVNYQPPLGYQAARDVRTWEGMIVGGGVIGIRKDRKGDIVRPSTMYHWYADLTMLPISPYSSGLDEAGKKRNFYWIIDDSRTKVHIRDSNTVYVAFDQLQRDLEMDEQEGDPARTSEIQIALKPGASLALAKAKVQRIVDQVTEERGDDLRFGKQVLTWEEVHATFIGAIEKEKFLVTFLFAIISIVAIFLIFCIFYMIVVEKTRDIGTIKSVGATSQGVAAIFLGYGAAIGIVGSALGLLVGWLIVRNINWIHDTLGEKFGFEMWNPEIYLFDTIPNTMNPDEVTVILSVAIISSIIGALVPAVRAARMHPVEALRWE